MASSSRPFSEAQGWQIAPYTNIVPHVQTLALHYQQQKARKTVSIPPLIAVDASNEA